METATVQPGSQTQRPQVTVFRRLAPPLPTTVFDSYWRFASERHEIFLRRLTDQSAPWTDDAILAEYKFTNVFRASDRISQFLIRQVLYDRERPVADLVLRTLLFKIFNKIETWQRLNSLCGDVTVQTFSVDAYDRVLSAAFSRGERLYSAAYIMPAAPRYKSSKRKHTSHLSLLQRMLSDDLPTKVADSKAMSEVFALLKGYPSVGDFLAYQFATDLNYNNFLRFEESEFVVPGPGARDGLRKCFSSMGDLDEPDVIRWVMDRQVAEFTRLGLQPVSLWGRSMQLIDCQNVFCEVDKYARVKHPEVQGRTGRTRIKQRFRPSSQHLKPYYPPKWGINDRAGASSA